MSKIARYTGVAMLFHWTVGILILLNVVLGLAAQYNLISADQERPVINFHKSTGLLVLVLVVLRLLWRFTHTPPALPANYKPWEVTASHLAHFGLYVVALGLPLSGWAHDSAWSMAAQFPFSWYGLFSWPHIGFIEDMAPAAKELWHARLGVMHTWFGYALYALLAAHVLGALKHQFIDKEPELQRMLPWGGE
jgi:cytochrome b561